MKRRLFLAIGLLALCLPLFVSAGSANYYPHAIGDFDGTNDYLTRGADLTGNADGKVGLLSCWLRIGGGDGAARYALGNTGHRFFVEIDIANKLDITGRDVGGTTKLKISLNTATVSGVSWHHLIGSWNLATAAAHLYFDDAEDQAAGATLVDTNIDYTGINWAVGSLVGGFSKWNGALAEVYFALEYSDLSVEANRRKFISASGDPVYLGADGRLATGTAPIIYMYERANNAGLNFGTGGHFNINGSPDFTIGPVPFFPLSTWTPGRGRSSGMRIH